jgi:hypothetical protein
LSASMERISDQPKFRPRCPLEKRTLRWRKADSNQQSHRPFRSRPGRPRDDLDQRGGEGTSLLEGPTVRIRLAPAGAT